MKIAFSLFKKLGLVGKLAPAVFRAAADGSFGPQVAKLYALAAGYKTATGLALYMLAEGLSAAGARGLCADCATWVPLVEAVGAFLVGVGLLDAAYRERPPEGH